MFLQISAGTGSEDVVEHKNESSDDDGALSDDRHATESVNRSSSFLFESLYDSSLLAGLSPLQDLDQSDEEEPVGQENGGKSPSHRSTQEQRCSELLKNQEAEQQEAIQWGESTFNLSEWGDSLLVGQHFLERQSLLKHTERTQKEHRASQHPKPDHVLPEEQTSETIAVSSQIQPQPISVTTSTPQSDKDNKQSKMKSTATQHSDAKNDNKPDGRQERKALLSDNAVFKHPHIQNAPESTFFCSPGLQEIFDHWPSMSDTTTIHAASAAEFLALPQPSIQAARKKGNVHVAACESDSDEEMPSRHGHEEITERPGSAADLIPPTQETLLRTPKVKLTTSSVQTPHAAQRLNQSTPSTLKRQKPEVTGCPKSHPAGSKDQSEVAFTKNPNSSTDSNHKQQLEQNPPNPPSVLHSSSKTNSTLHTVQNLSPSRDQACAIDNGFTPQLSQDASLCSSNSGTFSIIDVASDRHLFETFINEWKTKERYSLSLACEKREDRLQPDGEMGTHKTGN